MTKLEFLKLSVAAANKKVSKELQEKQARAHELEKLLNGKLTMADREKLTGESFQLSCALYKLVGVSQTQLDFLRAIEKVENITDEELEAKYGSI